MIAFLDTSALVKLYHQEDGTTELLATIANDIDEIWLSDLAILEFRSALWKKVRTGEISKSDAINVVECFSQDQNKFRWVPLDRTITNRAVTLLMKYGGKGLRTLDSIQFAAALHLKPENPLCLTFDTLLLSLFREEQLTTD
jgi:predicted nucleic acid-binding protein